MCRVDNQRARERDSGSVNRQWKEKNLILYVGNKNIIKKKFLNVLFPSKAATLAVPGL